jgi:nitrogen regulatory protein PII
MKYIVITAISEYETEVKRLLKKCEIGSFSFHEISGYKDPGSEEVSTNWFASDDRHVTNSVMFHVFATEGQTASLFNVIKATNAKQEFETRIHIASMNVEISNF